MTNDEKHWQMVADGARLLTDSGREVAVCTKADPHMRNFATLTAVEIASRWNTHDQMLAALRGLLVEVNALGWGDSLETHDAEDAIASAEGREPDHSCEYHFPVEAAATEGANQ